mmetsp:Transcript_3755/g.5417  ORF Transcript_3755/g.5417 Transcript_3755/m.5417 type:complete len:353 (+) Transcript_3755:189-1247(+)
MTPEEELMPKIVLPVIPFEVLLENICDFAEIETLFALRRTCRTFKKKIDEDLSHVEWFKRTLVASVENPLIHPKDIHVKSRLSLACISRQCCMLCGATKRKKQTYPEYGVYAHEKCLREQLISSEMLSSQGCMQATRIVRREYCYHTDINAGRWNSRRIWEMPRWCVRNTMYDLLVVSEKIQQFECWTKSGFQQPFQLKWTEGTALYRKYLEDKYRRQLKTGVRERMLTAQQRSSQANFEQLRMLLGENDFNRACQLLAELVSLRRKIRRKYGKLTDLMLPEPASYILKIASNGDLKQQFHFVKYGYTRALYRGEFQYVGKHMSLSKWQDMIMCTSAAVEEYYNCCKLKMTD